MKKIKEVMLLIEKVGAQGRGIVRGVAKYSRIHGPWAIYLEPQSDYSQAQLMTNFLHADGIILHDLPKNWDLNKFNIPVVLCPHIQKPNKNFPYIRADDQAIGKMAAEHFISRGFYNFAYCGFSSRYWSHNRQQKYIKELKKFGFTAEVYESSWLRCCRAWEQERTALGKWLTSLKLPLAVFACNDYRSRHLVEACKIVGLQIPEQIAILGVDNDDIICEISEPSLSSILLDTEKAGYEAASLLDRLIAGKKVRRKVVNMKAIKIIERRSTDITATEDELLSDALRFINCHRRDNITVDDIANALIVSRRTLEKRFRKYLNRSVHDEIIRVRVQEICWILNQTRLSLTQIAKAYNYTDIKHISRVFRQHTGTTMSQYRRSNTSPAFW